MLTCNRKLMTSRAESKRGHIQGEVRVHTIADKENFPILPQRERGALTTRAGLEQLTGAYGIRSGDKSIKSRKFSKSQHSDIGRRKKPGRLFL